MSSVLDRLKAKQKNKTSTSGSIRDRFVKRSSGTLQKTFDDKDKRSGSGGGKSVFNQELMEELGLVQFKPNTMKEGKYFVEILPDSIEDPDCPYFIETPIHEQVGIGNDQFLCMLRFKKGKCFRCLKQNEIYQKNNKQSTSETVAMFPRDKVVYLVWNRTDELGSDKTPDYTIGPWLAPKTGVHAELQKEVRDKKTKRVLDISDVSEGGEGRTVYFEVELKTSVNEKTKQKQTFPNYTSFDLLERDEPIPDEVLEKLYEVLEKLQSVMTKDMKNPLEALLYYPEENEIQEAMETEIHSGDEESTSSETTGKKSKLQEIRDKKAAKEEKVETEQIDLDELENELTAMNSFKLKKWVKENHPDYFDSSLSKEDQIIVILEHVDELNNADSSDIPF